MTAFVAHGAVDAHTLQARAPRGYTARDRIHPRSEPPC
ncbi:MAG: hypothetical protein RL721_1528, partial [Candidatus Eisenbacteria bacterium]